MEPTVGERFARAVAAKDAGALKRLLAPKVRFRALTPGNIWECSDADAVVDDVILGTWFSEERSITQVLAVDCDRVGSVDRVGYRFQARLPGGDFVVEQQVFFKATNNRISLLHILCSGFVPDEEAQEPLAHSPHVSSHSLSE
jgi:hypothetical protein